MLAKPFLPSAARAIAVAAFVTASGLAPAPAEAQGFGFSFGERRVLPHRLCLLTDSGLRRAIRRQGFEDIYLNVPNDSRVQARASRGSWVYLLTVNSCTGRILDGRRLRRR